MRPRLQQRPTRYRLATSFQQSLFAGFDENNAGGKQQRAHLQEDNPAECLLEETIEPGFGHLETELIIHRLGGGGDKPFGLPEKSHEPAIIKRTLNFAFHPRAIELENEIHE